jgi:glyoxylase-like metal-dependent hydrolase (beta-lactamase superfamily II)/rhodanese-related sulfurtransferase
LNFALNKETKYFLVTDILKLYLMQIEQIYTGCLAQGAYYITSNGEAVIIDPLRETEPYMMRLERDNVKLKYIFETHFHADFVSGHVDLSNKTGAQIVYGPNASCKFNCLSASDGHEFKVGDISIKVIHTPGHTMESSCFLLKDETGKDVALFSGDTLFLGDVGRPDLAQKAANLTKEELAGLLYDSLYKKILPLADDIIVYPAHGAGSACGKNMMKETVDTLGNQKKTNYALNQPSKEAFVTAVLDGLTTPPGYFGMNVTMNKVGYESFETVLNKGLKALFPNEFEQLVKESGALILDTRSSDDFYTAFIPQSINIGLNGDFAPWVGALIKDVNQPILLVTEIGKEQEAITRLARVGFDNQLGYLKGSIDAWMYAGKHVEKIERISTEQFELLYNENAIVIDVRKESEFAAEHIIGAQNKPLAYINEWMKTLTDNEHFFMHCAGGYRSMIAASFLMKNGINNFSEINGGYTAIVKTNVPRTQFVCQSKKV